MSAAPILHALERARAAALTGHETIIYRAIAAVAAMAGFAAAMRAVERARGQFAKDNRAEAERGGWIV